MMASAGGMAAAGGLATGTGVISALTASPWPVVALLAAITVVVVLVWLPFAALLLTPVFSRDSARCKRAAEARAQVVDALRGRRAPVGPSPVIAPVAAPGPAASRPQRHRRQRRATAAAQTT